MLTEDQKQQLEELQRFKNREASVDIEVRVFCVQMLLLVGITSQAANRLNRSGAGGFEGEAHSSAQSGEDAVSRPGDQDRGPRREEVDRGVSRCWEESAGRYCCLW